MYNLRCSSLDRILKCSHSLRLIPVDRKPSEAAIRGRDLHEQIAKGIKPEDAGARAYREFLDANPNAAIEHTFPSFEGKGWVLNGTADCIFCEGDLLTVIDFKSGQSPVSILSNQLKGYGFLALKSGFNAKRVNLGIFQGGELRSIFLPSDMVLKLEAEIDNALADWRFEKGSHCRYCPGKWCCSKIFTNPSPEDLVDNKSYIEAALEDAVEWTKENRKDLWEVKESVKLVWKKGVEIPTKPKDLTVLQAQKAGFDTEGKIDEIIQERWKWIG